MGFKTDIGARAGALRYYEKVRCEFESIRPQSDYAVNVMPEHRRLVGEVVAGGFRPSPTARSATKP